MKKRMASLLLGATLIMAITPGCIGPFNAQRRLHTWNREIENRWVGAAVYLPFRFIIAVAAVGDLFIFNSIQFWGGTNPIDPVSKSRLDVLFEQDEARARESRGEAEPDDDSGMETVEE